MAFAEPAEHEAALMSLLAGWENAEKRHDTEKTNSWAEKIFTASPPGTKHAPLRLLLRGTPFQIKVWEALLRIPEGEVSSYGLLARRLGYPSGAARAVGSAVGANAIAYLIPCHRVIRGSGALGGYRWGLERKVAMLGWERARQAMAG
jgi:AraC family transcriptional regulator of adaptative response/methylated-DNA-[protein]-cysteine methyltransferase